MPRGSSWTDQLKKIWGRFEALAKVHSLVSNILLICGFVAFFFGIIAKWTLREWVAAILIFFFLSVAILIGINEFNLWRRERQKERQHRTAFEFIRDADGKILVVRDFVSKLETKISGKKPRDRWHVKIRCKPGEERKNVRAQITEVSPEPMSDDLLNQKLRIPQRLLLGNFGSTDFVETLGSQVPVQVQLLGYASEWSNRKFFFENSEESSFIPVWGQVCILKLLISGENDIGLTTRLRVVMSPERIINVEPC